MELFEEIRREYEYGIGTIKGVARKPKVRPCGMGVHRRLVREAIDNAIPRERKTVEREKPKLRPALAFINGILESDQRMPRKQRHTAHRIWRRLQKERPEVEVGESTVREHVRRQKQAMGLIGRETFIPQSYHWGGEAQVDWHEAQVELEGEQQKVYFFCLRSMASGGAYHRAYPHASQQAFLEGHELAFAHLGGVFRTLRYDNLSSAVKKILRGHQREETERFMAFRSHWRFQSAFCNPGEGHEKGGVEEEGGYFRRNYLVPLPQARDLEELNQQLIQASKEDEKRVIQGRSQSIGSAMIQEREHLLPLAGEGFPVAAIHFPRVNASGCVKVLTNFYSAPLPVGVEAQARVGAAYVEIWHQGKCVVRHERCFGRQQQVLDLEHYLDVLMKKPGAFEGSTPLERWRAQGRWPASYDRFWAILKERQGKQEGTRAMIAALQLGSRHGYRQLEQAVEQALQMGCSDVGAVRLLLDCANPEKRRPPLEAVLLGDLSRYDRPLPKTDDYDQLLRNWAGSEVVQ